MSKHSEESAEIGVDYMTDACAIAVGENTLAAGSGTRSSSPKT